MGQQGERFVHYYASRGQEIIQANQVAYETTRPDKGGGENCGPWKC